MFNKNDPLIGAVQEVMKRNQAERDATKSVNEKFGIEDRKALPHEKYGEWDAAYNKILTEGVESLSEDELNDMGKGKKEKAKTYKHKTSGKEISAVKHPGKEWELCEGQDPYGENEGGSAVTVQPKQKEVSPADQKALADKINTIKEDEQIAEKAPPGDKYERMVKHIKSKYSKNGLTDKEKAISYATAWKAKKKDVNEGFNDRHNSNVTASDGSQVVAEAGGVNLSLANQNKKAPIAKKPIPTPFPDRANGVAPNRNYKSQVAKVTTAAQRLTGKTKPIKPSGTWRDIKPSGELKADNNYTLNKYKDKAETFLRAATGDIGDTVGITDPKRTAGLNKFNPAQKQMGDLAGVASVMIPGGAEVKAIRAGETAATGVKAATTAAKLAPEVKAATTVATTAKPAEKAAAAALAKIKARGNAIRRPTGAKPVEPVVKTTQSGVPAIAKAEGQGNRLAAAKRPGENGPWGNSPTGRPASTASTVAKPVESGLRQKALQTAQDIRAGAARKAATSTVNTARLVAGPNGPSSGSSIGSVSSAAAATSSPTVKARQQLAAVGNQTGGVNNPTAAKQPATSTAPKPTPKPVSTAPVKPGTTPTVAMAARKIEATPRKVNDTEIMNAPQYKQAVKSVGGEAGAKKIQAGTDVAGVGKVDKDQTIWSKVKSQLEKQPVKGFEAGANKGGAGR